VLMQLKKKKKKKVHECRFELHLKSLTHGFTFNIETLLPSRADHLKILGGSTSGALGTSLVLYREDCTLTDTVNVEYIAPCTPSECGYCLSCLREGLYAVATEW
jgi:hypothetical protein